MGIAWMRFASVPLEIWRLSLDRRPVVFQNQLFKYKRCVRGMHPRFASKHRIIDRNENCSGWHLVN
jgi:hypothetical protein